MLKSCNRCGKIHDINYNCYSNIPKKSNTNANNFRKTYKWTIKSKNIRDRDKNLCKICLADLYNTNRIINFSKLEVHHIIPIEEDYNLRLDDDNLITLCSLHHKLAELGTIPRKVLKMFVDGEDFDEIKKVVGDDSIPPTF